MYCQRASLAGHGNPGRNIDMVGSSLFPAFVFIQGDLVAHLGLPLYRHTAHNSIDSMPYSSLGPDQLLHRLFLSFAAPFSESPPSFLPLTFVLESFRPIVEFCSEV